MARLFEVILGADDGLYHLLLGNNRVLRDGYSTPEDAWKAFDEKHRAAHETQASADRAITAGENVVQFPTPDFND